MRGKDNQGEGRLPENSDQQKELKAFRDISEIDCQEGAMERGETGGNFQSAEDEKISHEKNPQ